MKILLSAILCLSAGSAFSASRYYLGQAESADACNMACEDQYGDWWETSGDYLRHTNECFCWVSDGQGGDTGGE